MFEAGDEVLKNHMLYASVNAKYMSVRTQNTLVYICGSILRDDIVRAANASVAFTSLANEIIDIAETEQMSLGVRFVEEQNGMSCIEKSFFGIFRQNNRRFGKDNLDYIV